MTWRHMAYTSLSTDLCTPITISASLTSTPVAPPIRRVQGCRALLLWRAKYWWDASPAGDRLSKNCWSIEMRGKESMILQISKTGMLDRSHLRWAKQVMQSLARKSSQYRPLKQSDCWYEKERINNVFTQTKKAEWLFVNLWVVLKRKLGNELVYVCKS